MAKCFFTLDLHNQFINSFTFDAFLPLFKNVLAGIDFLFQWKSEVLIETLKLSFRSDVAQTLETSANQLCRLS